MIAEPRTILIVEEHTDYREFLSELLERSGHRVSMAGNGPEAFEIVDLTEIPFDMALINLGLPNRPGPGIIRALKLRKPDTFVVAIAANVESEEAQDVLLEGAAEIFRKPLMAIDLLDRIAALQIRIRDQRRRASTIETQDSISTRILRSIRRGIPRRVTTPTGQESMPAPPKAARPSWGSST